ncbi:MAG: S24 family peptidase [Alphaproteobacteria bacterium]
MISHNDIWTAIDALAARHGMSVSGLARRAGLDPTAFNRSKRVMSNGKRRWPTTESISKVLAATGDSFANFASLVENDQPDADTRIPVIGFAQAGVAGYFDDGGFPVGSGWEEVSLPNVEDTGVYALKINGDSMEPVFREGDIILISPRARIECGDRCVVKTVDGEVMAKQLARKTEDTIELHSLNPAYGARVLPRRNISWAGRIMWASQ